MILLPSRAVRTEESEAEEEEGATLGALVICIVKSGLVPKAKGPLRKALGGGVHEQSHSWGMPPGRSGQTEVSSIRGGRTEPQQLTRSEEGE